jgi:hypothetical protein
MSQGALALDQIQVASPCPASWETMAGDDRVRFCPQCTLNVYNLSGMSRPEAEALVQSHEGRLCVRFYRRGDGTVLTRDCPVGLQAARKRLLWILRVAAVLLLAVLGWAAVRIAAARDEDEAASRLRDTQPFKTLIDWVDPEAPAPPAVPGPKDFIVGKMMVRPGRGGEAP